MWNRRATASVGVVACIAGITPVSRAQLQTIWQRAGHPDVVVFSPDGRTLANGGMGAELFDAATGVTLQTYVARFNDAQSLAFSPDGAMLAEGVQSFNQNLNVFQTVGGTHIVERITDHQNGSEAVAFSPNGAVLATAGRDANTLFYTVPGFTPFASVPSGRRTFGIAYSPDGSILATTGQHGVALWRTSDYSLITWLIGGETEGSQVAFSHDGSLIASSFSCTPTPEGQCTDGSVRVWRMSDFALLYTLHPAGTDGSFGLSFSPDGRTLAVGGDAGAYDGELGQGAYYGTLRLWNVADGTLALEVPQDVGDGKSAVLSVAFSPDGSQLAYSRYDGIVTMAAVTPPVRTCSADFNHDGDVGTDADIEAFFACLAGSCCAACDTADYNGDGDVGTDRDIEAFFRVIAGGHC